MKYAMLPEGAYLFHVESVGGVVFKTGNSGWEMKMRWVGTNRVFTTHFSANAKASWKWRELGLETLYDLPLLVGRDFLCTVVEDTYFDNPFSRVDRFLAEIIN